MWPNETAPPRASGGDGGTCEDGGNAPPGPPSVGDVMGSLVTSWAHPFHGKNGFDFAFGF